MSAGPDAFRAVSYLPVHLGEDDTPSYHAEALKRAIPGAKLTVLEGGGHSLSRTRPDEFNRLVLEFLEK